jgi:hypothetical protein
MAQAKPCWSWTGVAELASSGRDAHLRDLVALLPVKKSSDEQIVDFLADLRDRFHRWLHQDEFGPSRKQQTASLRALMKSFQALQRQLIKGSSLSKRQLDAVLRSRNDPSSEVLEALYESAVDVRGELSIDGAPKLDAMWAARLRDCINTLMAQLQTIDTNADGEVFLTAARRRFDRLQATGLDFALADAERWLNNYWNVVFETLSDLNRRRGAEERVSLKLLVEQLCELWERETGSRVTAHGVAKDVYTRRVETQAGRFVTAAVEVMLPKRLWRNEHAIFAHSVRALTFLPGRKQKHARAHQILTIMRDFVRRQPKIREERRCTKN